MTEQTHVHNPFMLMTHPEVVLAAVERSERLDRLNRRLCRPLDRPAPGDAPAAPAAATKTDDAAASRAELD